MVKIEMLSKIDGGNWWNLYPSDRVGDSCHTGTYLMDWKDLSTKYLKVLLTDLHYVDFGKRTTDCV